MLEGGKARRRCGDGRNKRNCHCNHIFVIPHPGILNITTSDNLRAAYGYVAYRSKQPKNSTVKDVKKDLQEKSIDVSQLADWSADHCQ